MWTFGRAERAQHRARFMQETDRQSSTGLVQDPDVPQMPSDPTEFTVRLSGMQTGFGCALTCAPRGQLRITKIHVDGSIGMWNRENCDKEIRIGDCIVEVDGIRGETSALLNRLRQPHSRIYELQLRRRTVQDIEALLRQMQTRDICPNDYDLLSLLDASRPRADSKGVAESIVQRLPFVSAAQCGASECAVCLTDFEPNSKVKQLPCDHCFCEECISKWLEYKDACPFCQRQVSDASLARQVSQHSERRPSQRSCEAQDTSSEEGDAGFGDEFNVVDADEGIMLQSLKMDTRISATKWKFLNGPNTAVRL